MKVNEIFLSLQGEGRSTGYPTVFVRFTGCNLRCSYCDTRYAYEEGTDMEPSDIASAISSFRCGKVCITGGEPLIQPQLNTLLQLLDDFTVSIETNGTIDLDIIKKGERHSFIMDVKTPSSGCSDRLAADNFKKLEETDEIKFVIGNKSDYDWARSVIDRLYVKGGITFSPVFGSVPYNEFAAWIIRDRLDVRFQIQLHKIIWGPDARGV